MTLISGEHLRYRFASGQQAVVDVSIAIEQGTVNALVGPNGCGKSTLLRILSGLLQPQSGQVSYRGRPLASVRRRETGRLIAYVPQNNSRAFPMTAMEEVLTGRAPHTGPFQLDSSLDRQTAQAAMARAGVLHLAERHVTQLSGGERQLVAVARAFAQQSECLLLDEPASSLDLKHRAGLLATLNELSRASGLTVLMVTHDLNLLDPGFDRIHALRAGELVASGHPEQVLTTETLSKIYDDPNLRSSRFEKRFCVWSEVAF